MPHDDALSGKENVCPDAQIGCNNLRAKLEGTGGKDVSLEQQRQEFEVHVRRGCSLDPVQAWSNYAKWAMDRRSLNADAEAEARAILARACTSLSMDPSFRDDPRYLRLWVHHASLLPEPHEVFHTLDEQGVGVGHALLYEAWASSLEQKRQFAETEEVYQLGLQRGAQPLDRLRSRHADFQQRQRRRAARRSGSHASSQVTPSPADALVVPASTSPALALHRVADMLEKPKEHPCTELRESQQCAEQPRMEQQHVYEVPAEPPCREEPPVEQFCVDQPPAKQLSEEHGLESDRQGDLSTMPDHHVSSSHGGEKCPERGPYCAAEMPAAIGEEADEEVLQRPIMHATDAGDTAAQAAPQLEKRKSTSLAEEASSARAELAAAQATRQEAEVKRPRSRSARRHEDVSVEEMRAEYVLKALAASDLKAAEEAKAEVQVTEEITTSGVRALFRSHSRETTGEITTSGVRALFRSHSRESRCSSLSRPSSSSYAFEDPTFTTEQARQEVLSILAHDHHNEQSAGCHSSSAPEKLAASSRSAVGTEASGNSLPSSQDKPEQRRAPGLFNVFEEEPLLQAQAKKSHSSALLDVFEEEPPPGAGPAESAALQSGFQVFEEEPSLGGAEPAELASQSAFQVFEETSLDFSLTASHDYGRAAGGSNAGLGLRRRSSGELRWDDTEFDAMMG
mmetsp:Transcript_85857/g.161647  ORF Transcript_85857/g.161647 Transcript_85857/m.161647 type:complete len:682 (+) Transcript_85857:71-2116(+)